MSFKVVGIGEALWDLLPTGRQMGGAPTNFAYHACALGADAQLITRVGSDDLGSELVGRLKKLGVPTDCVEVDAVKPTGTVTVTVEHDGQPRFIIYEGVAWDNLAGGSAGREAVSKADAVCFGTLGQRLEPARSTIQSLVSATLPDALRIFDVNLRQHFYSQSIIEESLRLANVLKVNDAELPRLAEMFNLIGDERAQISQLVQRHKLCAVAYTRGERGSLLFVEGQWSDHPGVRTKVVDTVGAGDAFTAAMTLGLLAGLDAEEINHRVNEVAAYVASCAGATPDLPEHMRAVKFCKSCP